MRESGARVVVVHVVMKALLSVYFLCFPLVMGRDRVEGVVYLLYEERVISIHPTSVARDELRGYIRSGSHLGDVD